MISIRDSERVRRAKAFCLFVFALFCFSATALAQTSTTKAVLENQNNAAIQPCGTFCISGSALNALVGNIIASAGTLADPDTWLQKQTFQGALVVPVRTIILPGAITVSPLSDYAICIDKSTGEPTTVSLPANAPTGLTILVKDCKGDAATNNITIVPASGTIDGSSTFVMNVNHQSVAATYQGAFWFLN